ncbi:MAG: SusC/RagA family TonB-linked outer membrane protein [Pedobacter sp.]|uniref:SusC/RagA family TonB-linked outer membrane protein n=1 Tax=Pedobacter sp. TaxID=1411316 RepID=UPI00280750D6|nr:SusC/RagA family TonB-linked outer membrane protein [Pedobacter sp.]MDQ8006069.1 SusC/RagA family TonB-linked outer membrane protein [Pedobacter sp.]
MNKNYLSRVMKIIMFILLAGIMTVSASSYSQQVTLKGKDISFSNVMDAIRKQTGYTVFGTKKLLEAANPITIDVKNMSLAQFMEQVTQGQGIGFTIEDKTISLTSAVPKTLPNPTQSTSVQQFTITGTVTNSETKQPLEGVNVSLRGTSFRTQTNAKGQYQLSIPSNKENPVIVFSYIGMKAQEISYLKQPKLDVALKSEESVINEIVVTGIYQRDREIHTGSSAVYTTRDLQVVGNQGILQSLKTLDPSFAIIDNNLFGSDPNRFPDVEVRGKSSVIGLTDEFSSNPNQPLFILDGFESTLAIISDLSMDRVASITVLKDASATAIYGSKAANGVIVVETKRPVAGQLRINYNLNSTVSFADLTDYNLMNAEEKLQFELLSGFYGNLNADGNIIVGANLQNEAQYFSRLKEVNRGVNTYWANEPLRTALTQRHTLFAEGGDANLRYSASFNYGLTNGVMHGSDRQATNGNIRLLYRKGKLSVNNSLSIDDVKANKETQTFASFSRANPYFRKYDEFGNVVKILEDFSTTGIADLDPIFSPMYDQGNLNINSQRSWGFTNNLEMEWRILESLRARGRFGIRSISSSEELFRSPFNSEFEETDPLEKGLYNEANGKNVNLDGDFSLTFGKLFSAKHMVNAVAGMRMEQNTRHRSAFQTQGFVDDEFANPNFALGYATGRRADYTESIRRGASFFINSGYAYDQRYLVDFTMRLDGSSIYGSDRQFSTIWSVGLGWNIHKETWIKDNLKGINQLRLRGSVGNPGNQNFDDYISMRIYRYNNENRNPFGASTIISNIGNRNLKWQTTLDRNIGLDLITLDNRLRINADYFVKNTDPLLVFATLPSSTGVERVAQNIGGQVTKGFTIVADYNLIRRNNFNWRVNMNMRQLRSRYENMGNQLNSFNENNRSRNLVRYYDGGSPSDLWAVRSLGIDPATGREVFLNRNNEQTFVHNYQDEVVVGNSEPKLEGIIGSSFMYKGFMASVNLRYRIGGQTFMTALYDKVENISLRGVALNQDRRALYDRWQKPGDNARFKAISRTEFTPISSRFVADNNTIIGESISVGYETSKAAWLKAVRASSITFRAYMNDIFNISTITNERGIDYPFARSVSFSAAVRF